MKPPDTNLIQNLRLLPEQADALRTALKAARFNIKSGGKTPDEKYAVITVRAPLPANLKQGEPCPAGIVPLFIDGTHRFNLSPLDPGYALTAAAAA